MAKEYSRINSKGIPPDGLKILARVNREKVVFFKDLGKKYQKYQISRIARSLAVKGLVDLCVIKRRTSKKSKSGVMVISPEKARARLKAMLQNPDLLKKVYNNHLKEVKEIARAVANPSKIEAPLTVEEFRRSLEREYLYLCKRGLPEKNMKVEGIATNTKGRAFEFFIKQTFMEIVEKINRQEISPAEALEEITKFKEVCYGKFSRLYTSPPGLGHGQGDDSGHTPGGGEEITGCANQGKD